MRDRNSNTPNDRPYTYDFDTVWDAESALNQRETAGRETRRSANPRSRDNVRRLPKAPAGRYGAQRRPTGKKRRPTGRKDPQSTLVLLGLGLLAVLILVGFIALISSAFSDGGEESLNSSVVNTTEDDAVKFEELTPIQQLVARADVVAAGYDYDGAVDILREYGTDWELQPELVSAQAKYVAAKDKTVWWYAAEDIPVLTFQTLIADPERAFASENAVAYAQNMVTVTEFRQILEQLYSNGYVLVRLSDITRYGLDESGDNSYLEKAIYLPDGKRPIVIVQNDVNYYEYMVDGDGDRLADGLGDGFASRLVVGEDGLPTCEYYTADGQLLTGAYDLVPILEEFVQEHPDFSYKGARGVVAVTGYEGVFGYHTHPEWKLILTEEEYAQEVRAAQLVAKSLKSNGWEIASHGFDHYAYSNITTEEIESDLRKWQNQVQPIVGETDIFVFLYGCDLGGETYSGDVYSLLYKAGFRRFCHLTEEGSWAQVTKNYVRHGLCSITGYALTYEQNSLAKLFDAAQIWDPARPFSPLPK